MKSSPKPSLLISLALAAGGLGLLLRTVLYATGVDHKGLLVSGHWAGTGLCILSVVTLAALLILTRTIQGPKEYAGAYPVSFPAALGSILAGSALALNALTLIQQRPMVATVLGCAAAVGLVPAALGRMTGKKVHCVIYALVCATLALEMILRYRSWNADPQVLDYVFHLGSLLTLMLAAYQQAAFAVGMGRHKNLWFFSLSAVYLCMVSLSDGWLLAGCGAWALTNLTAIGHREE